jgi:hypothetical protein
MNRNRSKKSAFDGNVIKLSKIPVFFNSRGTSTAVLLSTAISVLLCENAYDKIQKNFSGSVNFDEPVLYIYKRH